MLVLKRLLKSNSLSAFLWGRERGSHDSLAVNCPVWAKMEIMHYPNTRRTEEAPSRGLGGGLDSGLGVGWGPGGTTWPVSRRSSQELAGDGWPHAPRRHDPLPGRAVAWGSSPLGSGCWERCPTCLRGSRGGGSLGPSHTSSWLPGRGTHPERSSGRPWAPLQKCSAHTAEPAPRRVNCGSGAGAAMRLPVEGGGPT